MDVLTVAFALVGLYVIFASSVWITGAVAFLLRRELKSADAFYDIPDARLPPASVIVPAFRERAVLGRCLEAVRMLDYPELEIIAVDDGSADGTEELIRSSMASDPRLRMLMKRDNEGKAMAMNDAIAMSRGEIIVVVDADAQLHPLALRFMAAHFVRVQMVGAVTGNPRPISRRNLLTELQVIEYASDVSLMRRAQAVWGRLMTTSGVISAYRRAALDQVGLFDPTMSTEDIELAWRLQLAFYDVRYEPRAVIGMIVPASVSSLLRQRIRWARGLAEVLVKFAPSRKTPLNHRQWPLYADAVISILWWHLLVFLMIIVALALLIPSILSGELQQFPWGFTAVIMIAAITQSTVALLIDRRYDHSAMQALAIAPWYPIFYWFLAGVPSAIVTLPTILRRRPTTNTRWRVQRRERLEATD
jgi:biofilm PGA synthesis N-glycosyltransferase PgaC